MRTTYITKPLEIQKKWYVVDASGHTLGRLSSELAKVLRGKNKPIYSPSVDAGDYVIVINAEKVKVTGRKADQKEYVRHSGWIGSLKKIPFKRMLDSKPEFIIQHAVKGMLPKNTLGRHMLKKLHVYAGNEHKHEAQKPELLTITY